MSLSFSLHVRCIFPCMSRSFIASHLATSPFVSFGLLVLCFPFIPPALPLFSFLSPSCPFRFPLVSRSFPLPFLSCRLPAPCMSLHFPLFPPLMSLHFLAFPLRSPISFRKSTVFPTLSQKCQNTEFSQILGKRRKETQTSKELAGGFKPRTPVLRHRLPEDYFLWTVIRGGQPDVRLGVRHAEQCWRIWNRLRHVFLFSVYPEQNLSTQVPFPERDLWELAIRRQAEKGKEHWVCPRGAPMNLMNQWKLKHLTSVPLLQMGLSETFHESERGLRGENFVS